MFPATRLRSHAIVRAMLTETHITPHDFIYPIFVEEDVTEPSPIASMPSIFRYPDRNLQHW